MTLTMKEAAPISSPMASEPDPDLIAPKVEKTSGLPLPNARKVTPAVLSLKPKRAANVLKFGQKKSLATIPTQEKRKSIQTMMVKSATTRSNSTRVVTLCEPCCVSSSRAICKDGAAVINGVEALVYGTSSPMQ
jgi:hypothetical protein